MQSPKQGSRRSRENQDIGYTNLMQELDTGIIVICQVKTVGYDVDKYTGKLLSLIGFLYCRQKIKLCSRPMIVIVHFD